MKNYYFFILFLLLFFIEYNKSYQINFYNDIKKLTFTSYFDHKFIFRYNDFWNREIRIFVDRNLGYFIKYIINGGIKLDFNIILNNKLNYVSNTCPNNSFVYYYNIDEIKDNNYTNNFFLKKYFYKDDCKHNYNYDFISFNDIQDHNNIYLNYNNTHLLIFIQLESKFELKEYNKCYQYNDTIKYNLKITCSILIELCPFSTERQRHPHPPTATRR